MNKPRILVVDDEPNLSDLIRIFLEKTHEFEVRVENRSYNVLGVAKEFLPDLILLDVDMPGKDGGEVAAEIKADPALCGVPIVFLTSLVSPAESDEGRSIRGGNRYLSKPVNPKVLVGTVKRLLALEAEVA